MVRGRITFVAGPYGRLEQQQTGSLNNSTHRVIWMLLDSTETFATSHSIQRAGEVLSVINRAFYILSPNPSQPVSTPASYHLIRCRPLCQTYTARKSFHTMFTLQPRDNDPEDFLQYIQSPFNTQVDILSPKKDIIPNFTACDS